MPSRCILHIGMHKTGSTSIQYSLARFSTREFVYAKLGPDPNHSLACYTLFASDPAAHLLHKSALRAGPELARLASKIERYLDKAIARARGRTLIISGEDIGALRSDDVQKMADFFRSRFDTVTVVAYVRPPAGFISSGFQQRVRNGGLAVFNPKQIYRNYQASFAKFDAAFGAENVQLWKFEPGRFPERDVVRDFCQRLQITLPESRIVRVNESLPREVIALLYTYNKFAKSFAGHNIDDPMRRSGLISALQRAVGDAGTTFRISPKLARRIIDENGPDIEWMANRLGESLDETLDEERPGDIRAEADLLSPLPSIAHRLIDMLGKAAPAGIGGESPHEMAQLVHALRAQQNANWLSRWFRIGR